MIYYKPTPAFIKNLASVLEASTPKVVQYFLVTDVLTNFVNFESSYEQSRYENRVSFCYTQTLSYFPFVYGYILYHETYDDMKYNHIYNLVKNISENGIKVGLNDATWMEDDASLEASLKKIQYLGIYVGLPPKITEYSALDTYYKSVSQSKDDFVGNLGALLDFAAATTQATMAGTLYDLISPWPSIFEDSGSYDSWLTGINAFYVPSGNYFTIFANRPDHILYFHFLKSNLSYLFIFSYIVNCWCASYIKSGYRVKIGTSHPLKKINNSREIIFKSICIL